MTESHKVPLDSFITTPQYLPFPNIAPKDGSFIGAGVLPVILVAACLHN
ncbi:hypothetical protein N9137_01320 [Pseudomonadales bacterium]|nr:hypothetical protein [Pseudomonadales bacterium]